MTHTVGLVLRGRVAEGLALPPPAVLLMPLRATPLTEAEGSVAAIERPVGERPVGAVAIVSLQAGALLLLQFRLEADGAFERAAPLAEPPT